MLPVHNEIWGTLNTIESSTNVHIKLFCSFNVHGMLKKIEIMIMIMISYYVLQKRLILKNIKKISSGKYAMLLYVAVSIRWISIRFDATF